MTGLDTRDRTTTSSTGTTARGPLARLVASGFARIAGISASLVGTQALTSVLGLVFWALAARQFVTSEVGIAGAAVALMMLLGSLGSLGLGTVLIARLPMTAQGSRRVLVRSCLAAAFTGGAVLGLIVPAVAVNVFGASALSPIAGSIGPLVLFAVGTGLTSLVMVLDQAVLTIGVGTLQLERNVTSSAVKVIALLGLGLAGVEGGMTIFAAWAIGNIVSLPLVVWRTRGGRAASTDRRAVDLRVLGGLGRIAVSHHALNVSIQAALQLLPVLVTVLVSAQENALFNAAIMLSGFVFALPYAVSVGLFAAARGDADEVVDRMRLTIPFGLAVSIAAVVVLLPLAEPVLHVFGPQYAEDGAALLRLVVLAGVPFVIKDHFIALRRVQGRTTSALVVTSAFLVAELAAAATGAMLGGTVGLTLGWLGVLVIEAIVLLIPLLRAMRRRAEDRARAGALATIGAEGGDAAAADLLPAAAAAPSASSVLTGPSPVIDEVPVGPDRGARDAEAAADVPGPSDGRSDDLPRPAPGRAHAWLSRNLAGPLTLVMALGVLSMAAAGNAGRAGDTGLVPQLGWVAGLVLILAPAAIRIFARRTPDVERVVLAVAMAMMLQFSRLMRNPTIFAFHDELIHARTLQQIDDAGRLFSFNSLLPVSAYYPGLEIATHAVQELTGLPAYAAATVTLLAARLLMVLGILALVKLVAGSWRAGAVGVVVYVANPQMLFFNSQYSYQTLALPLAVLAVFLYARRDRSRRRSLVLPILAAVAVVLTHHLTAVLLVAAYVVWLVVVLLRRRAVPAGASDADALAHRLASTRDAAGLGVVIGGTVLAFAATLLVPGNPLTGYLGAIGGSSATELARLLEGGPAKEPFVDSAGTGPAPWEQVLLVLSVLIATASLLIVLGFVRTQWRLARPLALTLGLAALLYPVIPGGHLTQSTAEVGDRASGFVFVGIAVVIGAWWWQRERLRRTYVAAVAAVTVLFLGSVVLGSGPTARQLPGPYEISSDARSIDASTFSAAVWMADDLPADSIVYGDRTLGGLAGAYGDQQNVMHVSYEIDASRLMLAPGITADDLDLVRRAGLEYLIVDERISGGLPHQQYYIENGEFGGDDRTEPVSAEALTKFDSVIGVQRVYDNGDVVVYDLRGWR